MYIKKYNLYKFNKNKYCFFKNINQDQLYFLSMFLWDALYYSYRMKPENFIASLDTFHSDGDTFELVAIDVDINSKLIYLSEPENNFLKKIIDDKERKFYASISTLMLCQKQLIKHTVISQENFIHVILTWTKFWQESIPFLLLYLDDKNWFDVLPFETEEAMEQFVTDHTQLS